MVSFNSIGPGGSTRQLHQYFIKMIIKIVQRLVAGRFLIVKINPKNIKRPSASSVVLCEL